MCNPIFKKIKYFIKALNAAHKLDATTRAILICPDCPWKHWFEKLLKQARWRLVEHVKEADAMFTGAHMWTPLEESKRKGYIKNWESICIFEKSTGPQTYTTVPYEALPKCEEGKVAFMQRTVKKP